MPVQVSLNTPLAEALSQAVQPKLVEIGWGNGTAEDAALTEYIILMLVNGKTEAELAADISQELLGLGPEDAAATDFARWLFQEVEAVNTQLNGAPIASEPQAESGASVEDKEMTMETAPDASGPNVPTGPKSMRSANGSGTRGGSRDRRMLGQMGRAMDRSNDVLHRVRGQTGNERINSHGRGTPVGPRGTGFVGRQGRGQNGRPMGNMQAGLNAMNQQQMQQQMGTAMMAGGMDAWGMNAQTPNLLAVLEQQNQLMRQMAQQLNNQTNQSQNGFQGRRGRGRGDHRAGGGFGRGQQHHASQGHNTSLQPKGPSSVAEQGDDMEMDETKPEAANPDETICKFNLKCNNKDCKFAHQSPAAPAGITIDVKDVCSFGAACKNFKCTARHPSPAARFAHQADQDCRYGFACANPRCAFRHPPATTPYCRNGASCQTPNCKFTHVKTKCKFNPCLNPSCAFVHDEGQQGGFKDKVWTAGEESKEHVSERKFVDESAEEEMVMPDQDKANENLDIATN